MGQKSDQASNSLRPAVRPDEQPAKHGTTPHATKLTRGEVKAALQVLNNGEHAHSN